MRGLSGNRWMMRWVTSCMHCNCRRLGGIVMNMNQTKFRVATSALDVKMENLVQDALEKTMVGRTCLDVAHRLSAVQKSDKISVIDKGRVLMMSSKPP
ncbi:ABC transporter B family member 15 [Camellia lanceoleosa]|nr:ABC transporter B family member 15 [Camellia lanceoleosa]